MRRNALMLGLCEDYRAKWDGVRNMQELADVGLDANGIEFLAEACADGWGLTTDCILRDYGQTANDYVSQQNGYLSRMYVGIGRHELAPATGYVRIERETLVLFIDCVVNVRVERGVYCKIHVARNCNLDIDCRGRCDVYSYGENTINAETNGDGRFDGIVNVPRGKWAKANNNG